MKDSNIYFEVGRTLEEVATKVLIKHRVKRNEKDYIIKTTIWENAIGHNQPPEHQIKEFAKKIQTKWKSTPSNYIYIEECQGLVVIVYDEEKDLLWDTDKEKIIQIISQYCPDELVADIPCINNILDTDIQPLREKALQLILLEELFKEKYTIYVSNIIHNLFSNHIYNALPNIQDKIYGIFRTNYQELTKNIDIPAFSNHNSTSLSSTNERDIKLFLRNKNIDNPSYNNDWGVDFMNDRASDK